ncbi:MAG: FAD binding domain-containing protein [Rubritepida sp.]|nr:FAD binding domain-containing protein [Rubritepida sp.]
MIAFTLNGAPVTTTARPTTTLLDWLRAERLTGTKEGCAEGDCGACTVVLEDGATRAPINACLAVLGQLHGRTIRTVEGLARDDLPHILAQADGTQCGFCTPGIVMAAWAHTRQGGDAHDALAGNLCRCTGYRPIVEAMGRMADDGATAAAFAPAAAEFGDFHAPVTLAAAVALRRAHPQAWLLAGGTDLGLRFSEHREHPTVISLMNVAELRGVAATPAGIRIGAAEPYAALMPLLNGAFASLRPYFARLGSRQIRAMGTVGGNLGTASPIGDALPVLLALDAVVETSVRRLPVGDFLRGYRRHALAPDEIIVAVELPMPDGPLLAEKLSRRHDQDISAVSLVACLGPRPRIALGGMGPMAARAPGAEAALTDHGRDAFRAAAAALAQDFAPMDDWRGGAAWRMAAAQGLMQRLWLRLAHPDLPAEPFAVPA